MDIKHENCTKVKIYFLGFLFSIDAFASAFIVSTFVCFFYEMKLNYDFFMIGLLIFGCNFAAAMGEILAIKIVGKINPLLSILLFHVPSNILLIFIANTQIKIISAFLLLIRFLLSQI
jgi:hypothetical protein